MIQKEERTDLEAQDDRNKNLKHTLIYMLLNDLISEKEMENLMISAQTTVRLMKALNYKKTNFMK